MASVSVRFDARQLKRDIYEQMDTKVKAVTTDSVLYEELLWALKDTLVDYLPIDTGALAKGVEVQGAVSSKDGTYVDKKGRVHHRTNYPRYGNIRVHARELVYNPYEDRPAGPEYYASRAFFMQSEDPVYDAQTDPRFIERAHELIMERMKENG